MFSKLLLIEGLLLIVHMRILTESTKDGIPQHFFWSERYCYGTLDMMKLYYVLLNMDKM
jgi:hypothetical protein